MGASAESSMEEPDTNAPAAMMTWASYPGMSQGSGVTWLSTGAAAWMPWQKAMTASGEPKVTAWMMSCLLSLPFGTTAQPRFSYRLAAKTADFRAQAVTVGARNRPW